MFKVDVNYKTFAEGQAIIYALGRGVRTVLEITLPPKSCPQEFVAILPHFITA